MSQHWKADGNINLEEKLKDERKTESSKIREDIMGTEGLKGEQTDGCTREQQPAGSWHSTGHQQRAKKKSTKIR